VSDDARREILARVAAATEGVRDDDPTDAHAALPRAYRRAGTAGPDGLVSLLEERLVDYGVDVVRTRKRELPGDIANELRRRRVRQVAIPDDVHAEWTRELKGVERLPGDASAAELDDADAVLTGCALAVAETGSLVLDGGAAQGRRALTLVPDLHLCVVGASQVVELVPEALERLQDAAAAGAPITWISGPSATSDIELSRVAGVHGPRTLGVLLVLDA
jgi:L-lactate dehydrogenase complex protein LldG